MSLKRLLSLVLLLGIAHSKSVSTWIMAGKGGLGNGDLTEALDFFSSHHQRFSSVSVAGYGSGGAKNVTPAAFNTALHRLGIDTYVLWGGQYSSFASPEAISATVNATLKMVQDGGYTGVDLDFEHPETWGPEFNPLNASAKAMLREKYTIYLKAQAQALHDHGLKMSSCVGSYPTRDNNIDVFYDPKVIGETNDVVRVMNYDMYYAGGRGAMANSSRYGMGPTSTAPWAAMSMQFWISYVPKEKLVMGIPAYSNDYPVSPGGGPGVQSSIGPPEGPPPDLEEIWDYFSQIYTYRYTDSGHAPRVRYGTELESTKAHLRTADKLGLSKIGFWTWDQASGPVGESMSLAVLNWTTTPA